MHNQGEPRPRSRNYSRNKGHRAEQEYAQKFRELGFPFCRTSREGSRLLDSCGIDLCGIPFNIQIKSGYKLKRAKADVIFLKMKHDMLKSIEPSDSAHSKPKILIQKIDGYKDENQLVTMSWKDFLFFLDAYLKLQEVNNRIQAVSG
jgi:hypothetical protein